MTAVPIRRGHRETEEVHGTASRDGNEAATSQGTPRVPSNNQKLKEAWNRLSQSLQKEPTLPTPGFWTFHPPEL